MKTLLPIMEGTTDIFDYISFLEKILADLHNVLSNSFDPKMFNLTMGLYNEKRWNIKLKFKMYILLIDDF